MSRWTIQTQGFHHVLTHYCDHASARHSADVLRQDIGGGYIRCDLCGEKFLPEEEPGNPRLLLRIEPNTESVSG